MQWLQCLASLRSLDCCIGRSTELGSGLSCLSLLTLLSLSTYRSRKDQWLILSLKRGRMLQLKTINLSGNIFVDDDILSVTNMQQLEPVFAQYYFF